MGERGPARIPTNMLKARGSWLAKTRESEPKPKAGKPQRPKWMSEYAKSMWKWMIEQLIDMEVMTLADRNALTSYCQLWGRWRKAEEYLMEHGTSYEYTDKMGNVTYKPYPQVNEAKSLSDSILKLSREFGMTPAARSRVQVNAEAEIEAGNPDENDKDSYFTTG